MSPLKSSSRSLSRYPIWLGGVALATVGTVLGALFLVGSWLTPPKVVAPSDAIVVLGGEFPLRMRTAIDLYRQGVAPKIWITGTGYSPPASVRLAREQGVPDEAVDVLASTNTWEDGVVTAAAANKENARRLMVVTSWYHSRRAMCVLAEKLKGSGVRVSADAAPSWRYDQSRWWQFAGGWYHVVRETAAFAYYWLRYGLSPWHC